MSIGIFFLIFAVLLVIGVPMAAIFGGMAFIPSLLDPDFAYNTASAIKSMVNGMDSYTLLAVPLFMLSGMIMAEGGISEKLFNFFGYFVGKRRSGFPCCVIITCMFYAAISGSSPATVSAVGAMSIPFLIKMGYDKVFSTAIVTVAGGLGVIIPPSLSFIVYSSSSQASPADLFIGGVIPGILIGVCLMVYAAMYCSKHGADQERLDASYQQLHDMGFWKLLKESIWALLRITVRGVLSSWEASATNCRCCAQAFSTGRTAQPASRMLRARNTRKLAAPMARQFSRRLWRVKAAGGRRPSGGYSLFSGIWQSHPICRGRGVLFHTVMICSPGGCFDKEADNGPASARQSGAEESPSLRQHPVGDPAGGHGHQAQVPGLRARADAAPQQGGEEHPQDSDGGGAEMSKKHRLVAAILVIVLVFAMLASLILPYMAML